LNSVLHLDLRPYAKGLTAADKIYEQLVKKRRLKEFEARGKMAHITATLDYSGFKSADMVIEAVVENMDIKKKVFRELSGAVSDKTILCTNTSALSVTKMAQETKDPSRVIGLHFFNPVHRMPLIEIVKTNFTSAETIATALNLTRRLSKIPILVNDSCGFIVNRILLGYVNEAGRILEETGEIVFIDSLVESFGMPMGPCVLLDEVGLDVASKVSKVLYGAFGDRMKPPAMMETVVKEGRLGKKNGKGIYLHEKGQKRPIEDTAFLEKFGIKKNSNLTDEQIEKRLIYIMVNEAARCLEEGLVREVSDIDVGMIFGTGFAPFRGGLLRYADLVGAENIVSDLEIFARNVGPRFKPSTYLQQLAVSGKRFYE